MHAPNDLSTLWVKNCNGPYGASCMIERKTFEQQTMLTGKPATPMRLTPTRKTVRPAIQVGKRRLRTLGGRKEMRVVAKLHTMLVPKNLPYASFQLKPRAWIHGIYSLGMHAVN